MNYIDELHSEMMRSPEYRAARKASEQVYKLASALIGARAAANMTQAEVAERMGTTQSAVARLEGGRSNPSAKILERYAKATGTRLRISFEPIEAEVPDSDTEIHEYVEASEVEPVHANGVRESSVTT